ncbi:hypothetical protein ABIF68_004069 [Bradyrhizobium japonicum]|nr:hypothetical protein [Bradyrhizobium japonicum]MCS3896068.1 hypothetical protein [Bradyrhizobium japonicum USDA 38]MCP1768540.1 hypothetical protein [Bradyrhizobium japonicum]MCP1788158.1 hypothetical protein [Bradyrhizobium japonicum]MCP1794701.1 hypothetical protein [Bradyrhizobium japonicum]
MTEDELSRKSERALVTVALSTLTLVMLLGSFLYR